MLTDWPAIFLGILLSLAAGAGIGWLLCRQRAALELARLRLLLDLERERCDCLSEIVARIEEAGEWEE